MANEFKHKDPGGELTQAEFVAACGDGHIFACQATGDILYASSATVLKNLEKGAAGTILNMGCSNIPAWNASPSFTALTLSGALDVNGTIDYDGTCVDFLSSGDIDIVSSRDAAAAVYIAQSTGTSGTIKISADTGTSVTEGAESINIISIAGGVGIRSTANLANAINLTVDSGTTSSIAIFNDTGNATGSICLKSDVGGITLNPGTFVTVGGNATNAGEVRILEDTDNGSNYVALKAPNVATSYTITLPTAVAGTCGFVLTSTTAGVTSWSAAAGGDVVCDTSPVLGGSLDASCETILNIGAAGNDILATGVRVINGAACAPSLSFTCDTDTGIYRAGANTIGWTTGGAVGMTLGAEHLTISDGNVIIGTAGHGVDFAAQTQSTATTTAELLDHYEEGTFTPSWTGSSGGAPSYASTRHGYYTRIGRSVHWQSDIIITSLNSLTAGNTVTLSGLPFTTAVTSTVTASFSEGLAIAAAGSVHGYVTGTTAVLYVWDSTTGGTGMTYTELSDDGRLLLHGTYHV
jgi:hypothetical protein